MEYQLLERFLLVKIAVMISKISRDFSEINLVLKKLFNFNSTLMHQSFLNQVPIIQGSRF